MIAYPQGALLFLAAGELQPRDVTVLLLSMALMLGLAKLLGETCRRWGQPQVLGEIVAGILLGATVLGQFPATIPAYEWIFPVTGAATTALQGFVTIAVALLLLAAGLEVDLSTVWRQGKATASVSLTGIVFPFAIGFAVAIAWPGGLGMASDGARLPFALFIGIAMSITALPVIAKILMDLNMLKSDMGMLIMSAAMVNDLIGWLGFAMVLALLDGGAGGSSVPHTIGYTLLFVLLMLTVGRWLFHRSLPYIQAHSSWPGGVLGFILVTALLAAALTEYIGIHAIFGAFIAGVAIGDSSHLRERTRDTIHQFVINIFAPVFFASIGLRVNFIQSFDLLIVAVVLVIAIVGKVGGCYLGAKWAGISVRESWAVGFGMSARGAMEIVLGQLAYTAGLITDELFVAIVIMALVTSLMSGPIMERLLRREKQRRLGDLLNERCFVAAMTSTTPAGAVRELAERAADATGLSPDVIYTAVWQREQMMSTGIGDQIAVPHARLHALDQPTVVIGRSLEGVDFNAPDGKPARLICLLLTPMKDQTAQIELLKMVAEAFRAEHTRAAALGARNLTEFLAASNAAADEPAPPV